MGVVNGITVYATALVIVEPVRLILRYIPSHSKSLSGCVAWFCPCITYGQNKHRYEYLNNRQSQPDGGCCNTNCMIHGALTSCGFGFAMQVSFSIFVSPRWVESWICSPKFFLRGEIRNSYKIKGGAFTDCLTAFCCTPCELTQESRELDELVASKNQYKSWMGRKMIFVYQNGVYWDSVICVPELFMKFIPNFGYCNMDSYNFENLWYV